MIDKVLRRAMWPLVGSSLAFMVAARLLHMPWLETVAWVLIGVMLLADAYFVVTIVALVVRHRRERRAANAAARERMMQRRNGQVAQ